MFIVFRFAVCFVLGSTLVVLVPCLILAYYKWRRLTAKTTNYVVNGASRQVSDDQKHKNSSCNGTNKQENGSGAIENGNKLIYSKTNGNHKADLQDKKKANDIQNSA